jgi:hypothetical protein
MTKRVDLELWDGSPISVIWNDTGNAHFNALVIKGEKPLGLIGYWGEDAYCQPIMEATDSEEVEGVLQEILAALLLKHKRLLRQA